jgi:hypothetical protein
VGWAVGGSNPVEGEVLCPCPEWPWCAPSHLHNGYRVSFPWIKRPGRGVDLQPPSTAEVKERAQLYLDFPLGLCDLFRGELYLYLYFSLLLRRVRADSQYHAVPLPRSCCGLDKLLSERRIRGMAGERHGMFESNTEALCK